MIKSIPNLTLYNFAFFQGTWFACVMFASYWAIVVVLPFAIIQLVWGGNWQNDMRTGVSFVLIGALAESFLLGVQAMSIPGAFHDFPPLWLLCLWFVFGISTHYSLAWLRRLQPFSVLWQVVFSALFAPLAYFGAEKLEAVSFAENGLYLVALAWAVTLPIGLLLTNREVHENAPTN